MFFQRHKTLKEYGVYPTQLPNLPNLDDLTEKNSEDKFDDWEDSCNSVIMKNAMAFQNALRRIRLCTFMHVLMGDLNYSHHFTWCPAREWKEFNASISPASK